MDYVLNTDGLIVYAGFKNYLTLLLPKLISDGLMDNTDKLSPFLQKTHKKLKEYQSL